MKITGKLQGVVAVFMTVIVALGLTVNVKAQEMYKATNNSYEGHYYMFVKENKVWQSAKDTAEYMGGHLVTITSFGEQKFLENFMSEYYAQVWIGGSGCKDTGFSWVTGESMTYENWDPGEPNGGSEASGMQMYKNGHWDDTSVNSSHYFLVEWESEEAYLDYMKSDTTSFEGHKYKYFDGGYTWLDAKAICESLGGHLITPTSNKENNMGWELCNHMSAWIGLSDRIKEGKFKWVTGERTDYMKLNADDYGDEDYVGYYSSYNAPIWNDFSNSGGVSGFICEWDGGNTILTAAKSSYTIKKGKSAALKYQIQPVKTKVTFTSSNKKVATVNSKGVVKGRKAGKATITIKAGGKTVKVKVTVK